MKIPDLVRIQGIEYSVTRPELVPLNGNTCFGSCTYAEAAIQIAQKLSNSVVLDHQQACVTLLHEVLHAFTHHAHISLDADSGAEDNKIDIIAHCMYQFLQDNGQRLFDIKEVSP